VLSVEGIEVVSLASVWLLEPRVPELLLELGKRGCATARVKPKSLGGYEVVSIESDVVAARGSTYVLYNPVRRMIAVEGYNANEVLLVFNEVEETLKKLGSDPSKGVLFYELIAKARAWGGKLMLKETVKTSELLGQELLVIPTSFISAKGDPNKTQWLHLDVRPIWTSWAEEKVRYEVILIYRDDKGKLLNVLKNVENILKGLIEKINAYSLLKVEETLSG